MFDNSSKYNFFPDYCKKWLDLENFQYDDRFTYLIKKADEAKNKKNQMLELYALIQAERFEQFEKRRRLFVLLISKNIELKFIEREQILQSLYRDFYFSIYKAIFYFSFSKVNDCLKYLKEASDLSENPRNDSYKFELAKTYLNLGFSKNEIINCDENNIKNSLISKAEHELNNLSNPVNSFSLKAILLKAMIKMINGNKINFNEALKLLQSIQNPKKENEDWINYGIFICNFMLYDGNDNDIIECYKKCNDSASTKIKNIIKELRPIIEYRIKGTQIRDIKEHLSSLITEIDTDDIFFENKISFKIFLATENKMFIKNSEIIEKLINLLKGKIKQIELICDEFNDSSVCEIKKIYLDSNLELYYYYLSLLIYIQEKYPLETLIEPLDKFENLFNKLKVKISAYAKIDFPDKKRLIDHFIFVYYIYLNSEKDSNSENFIEKAIKLDQKNLNLSKMKIYYFLKKKDWDGLIDFIFDLKKLLEKKESDYLTEIDKEYLEKKSNKNEKFEHSDAIYKNEIMCEILFTESYSRFHQAKKLGKCSEDDSVVKYFKYLIPNKLHTIRDEICESFIKFDLEYDHMTSNFLRSKSNELYLEYKVDTYDSDENDNEDLFDLDIIIKLRLKIREPAFNEFYLLYKTIVEYEADNIEEAEKFNQQGLQINQLNLCLKYMRSLILIKKISKNYLRTAIIDKENLPDVELEEVFKLRKFDKFHSIHEYYRLKVSRLIVQIINLNQVNLNNLNKVPFKLNRHLFCLICLYNESYDQIIIYIKTLLDEEKEINSNSLINLRVDPKYGKYLLLLKMFYFFLEKLYFQKNFDMISNLSLYVDQILSIFDENKTIRNDYVFHVELMYFYLGVSYFKTDQFKKSAEIFRYLIKNFDLIEIKNKVVFFEKIIMKINLKNNSNKSKISSNEIIKLIEELQALKTNEEKKKDNRNFDLIKEIDFHIGELYFLSSNYCEAEKYLKNFCAYFKIQKNAFTEFDLIKLLIELYYQKKEYPEVFKFFEKFNKEILIVKSTLDDKNMIYIKGASYFYRSSEISDRESALNELFNLVNYLNKDDLTKQNENSSFYIDALVVSIKCIVFLIIEKCLKKGITNQTYLDLIEKFEKIKKSIQKYINDYDQMIDEQLLKILLQVDFHLKFFFDEKGAENLNEEKIMHTLHSFAGDELSQLNDIKSYFLLMASFKSEILNKYYEFSYKSDNQELKKSIEKCIGYLKNINTEKNELNEIIDTTRIANIYFVNSVLCQLQDNHSKSLVYLKKIEQMNIPTEIFEQYKYFFVFEGLIGMQIFKTFSLFKLKQFMKCQTILSDKVFDTKLAKYQNFTKDAIGFYKSYCKYKLTKAKEMKYEFDTSRLDKEKNIFFKEVTFFEGKCFFKNNMYNEALYNFNFLLKMNSNFSKSNKLKQYMIFSLYKLAIRKHREKNDNDKEEFLKQIVDLIDEEKKLVKDKKSFTAYINLIKYKANSLYLLEDRGFEQFCKFMSELRQENENLINELELFEKDAKENLYEILDSSFISYLHGLAIMKKLMKDRDYHLRMLNSTKDDKINYFENLDLADKMFNGYLKNYVRIIKNDKDLEYSANVRTNTSTTMNKNETENISDPIEYDFTITEKIKTSRFYIAIINQHLYKNKNSNDGYKTSLKYFIDLSETSEFKENLDGRPVLERGKTAFEERRSDDYMIKSIKEHISKIILRKEANEIDDWREFKYTDYCFYFSLALYKSKLMRRNEKDIEIMINMINFSKNKVNVPKFIYFYLGLVYFEIKNYDKAMEYLSDNCNGYLLEKLYSICSKFRAKAVEYEFVYYELCEIIKKIECFDDLNNFTLEDYELLVESIFECLIKLAMKKSINSTNITQNIKNIISEINKLKSNLNSTNKNMWIIQNLDKNILEKVFYAQFFSDNTEDHLNLIERIENLNENSSDYAFFYGPTYFKIFIKNKQSIDFLEKSKRSIEAYLKQYEFLKENKFMIHSLVSKYYLILVMNEMNVSNFFEENKEFFKDLKKSITEVKQQYQLYQNLETNKLNTDSRDLIQFFLLNLIDENQIEFYLMTVHFILKEYENVVNLWNIFMDKRKNLTKYSNELDYIDYIYVTSLIKQNFKNRNNSDEKKISNFILGPGSKNKYYSNILIHSGYFFYNLGQEDKENKKELFKKSYEKVSNAFKKIFTDSDETGTINAKLESKFNYNHHEIYLMFKLLCTLIKDDGFQEFKNGIYLCEKGLMYLKCQKNNLADYFEKKNLKKQLTEAIYDAKIRDKHFKFFTSEDKNEDIEYEESIESFDYYKGCSYFYEFNNDNIYLTRAEDYLKKYLKLNVDENNYMVINSKYLLNLISNKKNIFEYEELEKISNKDFKLISEKKLLFKIEDILSKLILNYFQLKKYKEVVSLFEKHNEKLKSSNESSFMAAISLFNLNQNNTEKLQNCLDILKKIDSNFEYSKIKKVYVAIIFYKIYENSEQNKEKIFQNAFLSLTELHPTDLYKDKVFSNEDYNSRYCIYLIKVWNTKAFDSLKKEQQNQHFMNLRDISKYYYTKYEKNLSKNIVEEIKFIYAWSLYFLDSFDDLFEFIKELKDCKSSNSNAYYYFFLGICHFTKNDYKLLKFFQENQFIVDDKDIEILKESREHFKTCKAKLEIKSGYDTNEFNKVINEYIEHEILYYANLCTSLVCLNENNYDESYGFLEYCLKEFDIELLDLDYLVDNDAVLDKIFKKPNEFKSKMLKKYQFLIFIYFYILFTSDKATDSDLEKCFRLGGKLLKFGNIDKFFALKQLLHFVSLKYQIKFKNLLLSTRKNFSENSVKSQDNNGNEGDNLTENLKNKFDFYNTHNELKKISNQSKFFYEINLFISQYFDLIVNDVDKAYKEISSLVDKLENNKLSSKLRKDLLFDIYIQYIQIVLKKINKNGFGPNEISKCLSRSLSFKKEHDSIQLRLLWFELNTTYENNIKTSNKRDDIEENFMNTIKDYFFSFYSLKDEIHRLESSMRKSDYDTSIQILEKLFENNKKLFETETNIDDEIKSCKEIIIKNYIKCYFEKKNYEECIKFFEKYQKDDTFNHSNLNESKILVSISYYYKKYIEFEKFVLSLNNDSILEESYFLLGFYYYQNFDFEKSIELFEKIEGKLKEKSLVYLCFAQVWLKFNEISNDFGIAEEIFKKTHVYQNENYLFLKSFIKYEFGLEVFNTFGNFSLDLKNDNLDILNPFFYEQTNDSKYLLAGLLDYFKDNHENSFKKLNKYIESSKINDIKFPLLIAYWYMVLCVLKWNKNMFKNIENKRSDDYLEILKLYDKIELTRTFLEKNENKFDILLKNCSKFKNYQTIISDLAEFYFLNGLFHKYKNLPEKFKNYTKLIENFQFNALKDIQCNLEILKASYPLIDDHENLISDNDSEKLEKIIKDLENELIRGQYEDSIASEIEPCLIYSYLIKKDYKKVEEKLKKLNKNNCMEINYLKGLLFFKQKNYEKAAGSFLVQIKDNPNHFNSYACYFLSKKEVFDSNFPKFAKKNSKELFKTILDCDKALFSSKELKQIWTHKLTDLFDKLTAEIKKKLKIFFSYNWDFQPEVKSLENGIKKFGFGTWLDIKNLRRGYDLQEQLENSIDDSTVVFFFLSNKYLKSQACNIEIDYTIKKGKTFLPIFFEVPSKLDWPEKYKDLKIVCEKKLYVQLYKLDKEIILDHERLFKTDIFYQLIRFLIMEYEKFF